MPESCPTERLTPRTIGKNDEQAETPKEDRDHPPLEQCSDLKAADEPQSGQPVVDGPRAQRHAAKPGEATDPKQQDFHRYFLRSFGAFSRTSSAIALRARMVTYRAPGRRNGFAVRCSVLANGRRANAL